MRKRKYNNNRANRPIQPRYVSNVQVAKATLEGEETPVAVHIVMEVRGMGSTPVVMQLDDPAKVGLMIAELARFRREVWPDTEPVDVDGWVAVDERLPEDKYHGASIGVLIRVESGDAPVTHSVRMGHYDYHRQEWRSHYGVVDDGRVTHWHLVPAFQQEQPNEAA